MNILLRSLRYYFAGMTIWMLVMAYSLFQVGWSDDYPFLTSPTPPLAMMLDWLEHIGGVLGLVLFPASFLAFFQLFYWRAATGWSVLHTFIPVIYVLLMLHFGTWAFYQQ